MPKKSIVSTVVLATVITASLGAVWMLTAQDSARADYLNPALRRQVEELKREVAAGPTTAENVVRRGLVLWDWLNAYSLTGGPVPVNATQELAGLFALQDAARDQTAPPAAVNVKLLIENVDGLIAEFRQKDEKPKSIPVIQVSAAGPYAASSFQSFEQAITIGDQPMLPGGMVMATRTLMNDGGPPQNTNPEADNYVSARASNPGAKLTPITVPWGGMHGGFRGQAANPAFRLEGEALRPGETITLTYGDRRTGSRGIRMPSFSNDRLLYPIYVSLTPNGRFLTPVWPGLTVTGNQAASVRATAPSVVAPGEALAVAVRREDDRWNRATGEQPAYELLLNGTVVRAIPPSRDGLVVVSDVRIDQPGTYRFQVRSADGKLEAFSNPVWVETNPSRRIYWGETHAHSGFSEGMGTVDAFYRWAREDAWLDFAGLSEHDIWMDDSEWRTIDQAVRRFSEPGRFIAFLAYEWTSQRMMGGHHNVFFRTPGRARVPSQTAYTLSRLYQGLREKETAKNALVIPHAHQAGDWRYSDPDLQPLVEIASMHGTFEWFGNYYLKHGAEIGFLGASDDHRTRPGYSGTMPAGSLQQMNALVAVRAPAKTADGIFDGLRERATYATSHAQRILMDFRVNDQPAGRRIPYSADRRIAARVSGTGPLDQVEIVKNGDVVYGQRFARTTLQPRSRVDVAFYSSSEPFIRDNPRGYREWKGVLEVEGAKLQGFQPMFDNRAVEFARLDPANPNRIQFAHSTRGAADKLILDLDQVTPSTRLLIRLETAQEHGVSPPQIRPNATIPGSTAIFPFHEMTEGLLTRDLPVDRHADKITVQLVNPEAPLDGSFEYVDRSSPRPGDYYYLRVIQVNGARAWSSPIWIGGERTR
ncbi:MAG: DUF3604 domain-containing protein [Bryobacteraceae bacterium]|nr:DUF3604 domain-containing protein [Bryobacteraceae bacterium]